MRIDRSLEEEEALRAGIEGDGYCDQHALTRCKDSTDRAKGDAARDICEGNPVQVAPVA
jgi:hypothetical protein